MTDTTLRSDRWRLPSILLQVIIALALWSALALPAWLSPIDIDGYMFWPVSGFAIAALTIRPQLFIGVTVALWVWGVFGPLGWVLGTLNLSTLIGPLIYNHYRTRWAYPDSVPARRLNDLGRIVVFSLLPSAFFGGSLLAFNEGSLSALPAAILIYLLSDFAGLVIFLPVVSQWLRFEKQVQWQYVAYLGLGVAVPLALEQAGFETYALVTLFFVLPGLLWLAQSVNRPTLSHALLLVFMTHLAMAYFGLGGYSQVNQLVEMAPLAMLLVAVFVTVDTLQAMREDRDRALNQAEWLAEHDNRAPALNERGLMHWSEDIASLNDHAAVLYKPVNSHIFLETLTWEQLKTIETRLVSAMQAALPGATIAKTSDLTLVAVLPSKQFGTDQLASLLQVEVSLDNTRFTLDGAVAAFKHLSTDMADNLARLNMLWSTAVQQANLRVVAEHSVEPLAAGQGLIGLFQQFRTAAESGGLELWLQPIQCLRTGEISKAEVLARLKVPGPDGDRLVNPGEFLPVFQTFNYLTEFDHNVLRTTFQQAREMLSSLSDMGTLNVNISGATLSDHELVGWLELCLKQHGVEASSMCIEITETDLVTDRNTAIENVRGMRALGFNVAIDDFGTGLASFEYLNHFEVNVLKLDGQFISDVADNPKHRAIVKAMVEVAESYQLQLVGEFVDNQRALDCLCELGVGFAQGYHIGRPKAAGLGA